MRRLVPALLLLAVAASAAAADPPAVKPLRALLITGGCCHDYTVQKELIAKGLEERANIEVFVVQQGGSATDSKIPLYEKPDWSKGFDIVLHDECFANVTDKDYVANILKPHKEGLPGVVIHCAMHCYRTGDDEWFKFCGVTSRRHGAAYPHEVLNVAADNPIMKDFGAAWANPAGELYWIEKVWPTATPLATAKNREKGNAEVCVWSNEYGDEKTRVFGTTLGHHNVTVESDEYLDLLTRGTLWACGKLDDPNYLKKQKPKTVRVDLAKGKIATASSEQRDPPHPPGHATDGKADTRWCADGASMPQRLQVDLGKSQRVTGVRIKWESPAGGYFYTVSGSPDGKTWFPAVIKEKAEGIKTDDVDLMDARYVRVEIHSANPGQWASLFDLAVYGDETEIVDPAAAKTAAAAAKLADVKVPEGFEKTLFAEPPAVNYPVFVAASPDGIVYVSSDRNGSLDRAPHRGCVYRLRDVDGDGRADESKMYVADVDSPRGLVWDRDRLYLMHPPHLSAFIDHDGDGVADEEKRLVSNIAFDFKDRPADHSSNGVTLGIDGWLYLAIGDFGFREATGADGRKLQLRGGGVVRVRPDGTGLELYSRGTRNILEVGLDPLLNGFARDNTNDGGGWDVRLHHFTGLEDHGYPNLYKNFADEAVAPLADYGGGSGCGACFIDEPGFPPGYSPALYTADWGRDRIYRHVMTPHGATFKADQTEFATIPRVTDLDVDANGHIYASSWKGATFTYVDESVGYVVRVTRKGNAPKPLPDLTTASKTELIDLLSSPSHRRRLAAQRYFLADGAWNASNFGLVLHRLTRAAWDPQSTLEAKTAAVYTLAQTFGAKATPYLERLAGNEDLKPIVIRAIGDREDTAKYAPIGLILAALTDANPRTRLEAVVALGRIGKAEYADDLVPLLADADPVIAHTAIKSLVRIGDLAPLLAALDRSDASPALRMGALRTLQAMFQPVVVAGLTARLEKETDAIKKRELFSAVARLHFKEGEWKGNSWGTRPDTTGPIYQPEAWDQTPQVAVALSAAIAAAPPAEAAAFAAELNRNRIRLDGTLERLLAAAETDARVVPAIVGQLAQGGDVPDRAATLLVRTAEAADTPAELRSQATAALLRAGRPEAFATALAVLPILSKNRESQDYQAVWNGFRKPDVLAKHAEQLVERASFPKDAAGPWAEAALLILANSKTSPEIQAIAETAVTAGWSDPARRARMLEAARLADVRTAAPQVLAALGDSDPAVAASAKKLTGDWKLKAGSKPTGPLVKSLPVAAAMSEAIATKGDAAVGEQVFARANCNKCHTVRPNEPLRGPYLPAVAKTYRRDQLAEAVLLPSKNLAQGFVTQVIALADGRTVVGFVTNESADSVTLRDANANEIVVPKSDVDDRVEQKTSVMPEGLVNELTVGELASLLDYLESLKDAK